MRIPLTPRVSRLGLGFLNLNYVVNHVILLNITQFLSFVYMSL
jgi:hypothetical protein